MSRAASPLKDRLIFVVGARRSGTNWLQRIIAAHPEVVSVPSETYLFHTGLPQVVERFHHAAIGSAHTGSVYMDRDRLFDALRDFCDVVFDDLRNGLQPDAERIVERTPDHVRHLDLLGRVYPDGRVVHIVRDGRDVARSLRSQPWGPSSIDEAAEEWRSAIEAARLAAPSLEHYHEVRYEDLLREPSGVIREIFEWLALDHSAGPMQAALAEAAVRFNVDPAAPTVSTDKWRAAFTDSDIAAFERVAAGTLDALGYDVHARRDSTRSPRPSSMRSVRRRIRRYTSALTRGTGANAELRDRQWATQEVVTRFLDAVARRDWGEVAAIVTDTVDVRMLDHGRFSQGRGSEGVRLLIDLLSSDPALGGTQLRGDVHPGVPTSTIVAVHRLPDGTVQDRVWALTAEGDRLGRVVYYRLPSGLLEPR